MADPIVEKAVFVDGSISRVVCTVTPDDAKNRRQRAFLTSAKALGDVVFVAIPAADYVKREGEVVVEKATIPPPPKGKIVNCVVTTHINYAIPPAEREAE